MSTLAMVRHGQASFLSDNYDQLSAVGREQSALLGSYFAALGEPIDRIYTGRWSLDQAAEAYQLFDRGVGGKGVFLM